MVLSLLAHFEFNEPRVERIVEHVLTHQISDGGWNCRAFFGATHGSFHTTISVSEGLHAYEQRHVNQRLKVRTAQARAREFLLRHRLFRSHRTGAVVDERMTRFWFPPRWHYDILRALDYFRACNAPRDKRLAEAIDIVRQRRQPDGRWTLQGEYRGHTFFRLEALNKASCWNTLRALRILRWWER
jgi:hypothetical protein